MSGSKISIFWFRRDLRLDDNVGLQQALDAGLPVLPVFIFDTGILSQLDDPEDRRVDYIHQAISALDTALKTQRSGLQTYHCKPLDAVKYLTETYHVDAFYCNRDYEPQALTRDNEIRSYLAAKKIAFHDYKDQVIFDRSEIVKDDGSPYTVYTPYANKWRAALKPGHYAPQSPAGGRYLAMEPSNIMSLEAIGFRRTDMVFENPRLDAHTIGQYDRYRDYPAMNRTSHLGIALRFGTISIRRCVDFALQHNETWLSELIWREFFMQILHHFPHVANRCFKANYENIRWRNNPQEFERWCAGKTGYPIVDAGMRQLNQTGAMHNRVRMIVASFLCKHLLIDWRWGEAYFASKLNDYDLAANNGNWQWAAGCGCDAAPYFRIFNPTAQTKKFDKDLAYIKTWNPDFETEMTPPIVDHRFARERTLAAYRAAL